MPHPTPALLHLFPFLCASVLPAQQPQPIQQPAPEQAAASTAVTPVVDDELAAMIRREGIEHSQVMRLLRDLTDMGHRLTGSDNFTRACDWAVAEFHTMGVPVVKLEKWGEWRLGWNRGAWRGHITSPIDLELYVATDAWTAGTRGPQQGVVVKAPDAPEDATAATVGGKWVYYSKRPGAEIRTACEAAGILGWVYRARDPDDTFPTRVRVFGNNRTAMLPIDQVPTLPEIAVRADQADQIAELLDAGKLITANFDIQNSFRDGGIPLYNVIAEIPGSDRPDEVVIISSHLDSWHQAQGCTDNGTGTTSTMEAARILMAVGAKPARTIRFCLWGGEEQGLLGSGAYVKMHRDEMEEVSAVFNHDTGTNWAESLTVADTMYEPMQRVVLPMQALTAPDPDHQGPTFRLNHSPTISGGGGSDHASFMAAGVPGLNWGLKGRSNYFSYTWHTQWDTFDVAIAEYQRHTSTVIALAALGTANLPDLLDRSGVVRGRGRQAASYAAALFDAEMDGFKFTGVEKDGRAATMGIAAGDVLWKAGGQELTAMHEIFQIAREAEGEKFLELELKRGEGTVKVKLDLEDLRSRRSRRGANRSDGRPGSAPDGSAESGGPEKGGPEKGGTEQPKTGQPNSGQPKTGQPGTEKGGDVERAGGDLSLELAGAGSAFRGR